MEVGAEPCARKLSCACWAETVPHRLRAAQPPPADGRYGDNPNRLYKHMQLQVILKPTPADVIEQYMGSLEAIGIDLRKHDLKLEEDNWESPTLGAWVWLAGDAGWPGNHPVHLLSAMRRHRSGPDSGGNHLWIGAPDRVPAGRRQRIRHCLDAGRYLRDVRYTDELQYSVYNSRPRTCHAVEAVRIHEGEARRLIDLYAKQLTKRAIRCSPLTITCSSAAIS